tara:strand:+ start:43 stop:603 length:561 start_codon:yes stop_codon:yes gene_type:complete
MKAVSCYIALNHARDTFLGKLICWVQAPGLVWRGHADTIPTHARLGFTLEDGSQVYFEALEGSGFDGPKPEKRVQNWVKNGSGRWTHHYNLDLAPGIAEQIHERAQGRLGQWSYSVPQLLGMYFALRFGARLRQSPDKVICSEAVARLLFPDVDLRENRTFENVTPLSIHGKMPENIIPLFIDTVF